MCFTQSNRHLELLVRAECVCLSVFVCFTVQAECVCVEAECVCVQAECVCVHAHVFVYRLNVSVCVLHNSYARNSTS